VRSGREIVLEPAAGQAGETDGLVVSFTYVADAARILEQLGRIALAGTLLPPVLNVAGPEPISVRRFAEELGRATGIRPRLTRAQVPRHCNLIANLDLLYSLVRPQFTPFADAVAETCQGAPPTTEGHVPCP
jgi:nucleoside-diphosphate-sugar epimerase